MDNSNIKSIIDVAELKFQKWLDKHKTPYLYINQNKDTFSSFFKNESYGKRPDFMILLPNFGFIFIDVKNKKIDNKYKTFCIDENEAKKYSSFQRKFNLQIWYAISNEDSDFNTWFWIPNSKVMESDIKTYISGKSGEGFFPIPIKDFIQISDNDSINRLFEKSF